MKPKKRQNEILSILRAMQKEVQVEQLSNMLDVTPLTIRRDLQQLFLENSIIRTHGGAILAGRKSLEKEYYRKVAFNFKLKEAIGKSAVKKVKQGEIILINDGSTTYHLAPYLGEVGALTVYTNSIAMISEISRFSAIKLYILGGEYDSELYSLSGSLTEKMLESIYFDLVFLGVDAINDNGQCMVNSIEEAQLTKKILQSGNKKILLADHTKIGKKGYAVYGTLQDFDLWITTPGIDNDKLKEFHEKTNIEVISL